uniref:Plasmid pRiA4b ORF-3 family protein n=1 Tax=uncultured Thiotrichaceae bacterium TaxID=298394 RepID=A0A6S6SVC3_9GAMM|nr:MAG: plasmid pRiA4b ORF-3 family protein [uncultured Thiotrichaceae bacterium]
MALNNTKIYQLKITLEDAKPPIWRRVLVESSRSLAELHWVIQIAMGWENSHLHQFAHNNKFYSEPSPFDDGYMEAEDSNKYSIAQLLKREKDSMRYEYDFGDGWLHKIVLEKIMPVDAKLSLPQCIKGKRACPPEDVGGVWGYEEMLDVLADKNHPEHEERLEWLGGEFDAEALDLDEVNQELKAWAAA